MHHILSRRIKSMKPAQFSSLLKSLMLPTSFTTCCWFRAKNYLRRRFAVLVTSLLITRLFRWEHEWKSWRFIYVKCRLFGMGSQSQTDSSQLTSLIVSFISLRVLLWSFFNAQVPSEPRSCRQLSVECFDSHSVSLTVFSRALYIRSGFT